MIIFEKTQVSGWDVAVRGMRNPLASWDRSDSHDVSDSVFELGEADRALMEKLNKAGGRSHAKFMRFINVCVDITAPRYWWQEFSTYKVGVSMNSCSTMFSILKRPLTLDDFSTEGLCAYALRNLNDTVACINDLIADYKAVKGDQLLQVKKLLPESYMIKATVQMNYEVLHRMYSDRHNHRLPEWSFWFSEWVKTLPLAELIMEGNDDD